VVLVLLVVLVGGGVLLVVDERLVGPRLPLMLVEQAPLVLAHLQPTDVRPHVARLQ